MPLKHLLILLFIAIAHGSAFPFTKLVLNDSVPPILMASLRMGLVLAILIPFWKFKLPNKKFITAYFWEVIFIFKKFNHHSKRQKTEYYFCIKLFTILTVKLSK